MSVGEKLKSIILRSQVGHNIYNVQTWITNINTRGKKVKVTDWLSFKVSKMFIFILHMQMYVY